MALAIYSVWLWQPERQIRLHTNHLLTAAENHSVSKMQSLIADSYTDRWKHDKEFAIRESNEVFRQFIFVTIQRQILSCEISGNTATVRATLKVSGSGSPVAEAVTERINALREPCVFTWQHMSGKPWDWKLIRFEQPELQIDPSMEL